MDSREYKKMKLATVFSGIGAPEYAARKIFGKDNLEIVFACDCGECKMPKDKRNKDPLPEEVVEKLHSITDPIARQKAVKKAYEKVRSHHWVKDTYFDNYPITEDKWHDDIRFIDGKLYEGQVDLFVGGSPCQSFSLMGQRRGLEDARGTLFYSYAKLIEDIQPKAFIFENVPGMLTHDHGRTWQTIQTIFNALNYTIVFSDILNSMDFGIPQNRRRLFVVGIKDPIFAARFVPPKGFELKKIASMFLEPQVDSRFYLGEKGFHFTTSTPARARINMPVIRTEKKNQQFNWNGDFVFEPEEKIAYRTDVVERAYEGMYQGQWGVVRKMTPRECHNLMGFDNDFVISKRDVEGYKQSGNSIVVQVIEALIKAIKDTQIYD